MIGGAAILNSVYTMQPATGLTTGWTTGCIVHTNIHPVIKLVVQPVCQPVVSCKRGIIVTSLWDFSLQGVLLDSVDLASCHTYHTPNSVLVGVILAATHTLSHTHIYVHLRC